MLRLLLAPVLVTFLHPIPQAPPSKEIIPPVPLVCNYRNAKIDLDGDAITIELMNWLGTGKIEKETGRYHIVWIDKPTHEVRYVGRYWFDECGNCVGVFLPV